MANLRAANGNVIKIRDLAPEIRSGMEPRPYAKHTPRHCGLDPQSPEIG